MRTCSKCDQELPEYYVTGDIFKHTQSDMYLGTRWMLSRISTLGWALVGLTVDKREYINGVAWNGAVKLDEARVGSGCQSRVTAASFHEHFLGFKKVK